MQPPVPGNEAQRLEALGRLRVSDTSRDGALDELVELAARVCGAPMAAVSIVGAERQWFRSQRGFATLGALRTRSICAHTILGRDALVIDDTVADPRSIDSDLVLGDPAIRFYAGAPIADDDGVALGALCVLDTTPRGLQPWQVKMLEVLARQVMAHLRIDQILDEREDVLDDLHDAQRTLSYLETHDALTGLLNRQAMTDLIDGLAAANASGTAQSVLLHIDIDEFGHINDVYGHAAGDRVLITIADRLHLGARGDDAVGRLGGDAFVVLVPNASVMGPESLARRLLAAVSVPIEYGELELQVTASVGIARWKPDVLSADDLLRNAAHALYDAKLAGGNGVASHEERVRDDARRRVDAHAFVRDVIAHQALRLHFQPVWSIADGRLAGHEALLRWRDDQRFDIGPGEFIAVAEEIGLVSRITELTVREACRFVARRRIGADPNAVVSVNVSALQLERDEVMLIAARALNDYGLDPAALVLEVTESAKLTRSGPGVATLRELHNMGIRLALDDFGTGTATLGLLRTVPFDVIKIDGSFAASGSDIDREVLRSLVQLGHSLGMSVVAEGVEEPAVLEQLSDVGCDLAQGYLLGRPAPADMVIDPLSSVPNHPLIQSLHAPR